MLGKTIDTPNRISSLTCEITILIIALEKIQEIY